MSLHLIVRVACLSFLCGFILCGCGTGANYAPIMSKSSREAKMREAKKFGPYRLYYAGEKVNGLPLTGISDARAGRWNYWDFSHGTCEFAQWPLR